MTKKFKNLVNAIKKDDYEAVKKALNPRRATPNN